MNSGSSSAATHPTQTIPSSSNSVGGHRLVQDQELSLSGAHPDNPRLIEDEGLHTALTLPIGELSILSDRIFSNLQKPPYSSTYPYPFYRI